MAPQRSQRAATPLALLAIGALWAGLSRLCFVGSYAPGQMRTTSSVVLRGMPGMGNMDMKAMEELMKDPEKVKALQAQMEELMADPEKKKMLEDYSASMQTNVNNLREDPEMKEFFTEIDACGQDMTAVQNVMKKYEGNEEVLRKFSQASGGPGALPAGMGGMGGAPAAPAVPVKSFKPGDQVIINGLAKAPELNGKKAMIVPPTSEEKKTLEGTDRLIVRLIDTGDQFAIRPDNLRTTMEEVDKLMSNDIEDMAFSNPALQTEAAKLRDSGALDDLANDPELKPIFEDIKKNGMAALEKYWNDKEVMEKINKVMR